ncbi:27 kDa hemolymph glycoprotein-like isoform X1 [Coccinella septempunctata]|uniref:27 kDa hemolymph glycoprotein-like isoform X1 n=1 Tax=Coccinella septempunctata TaxID=41139 RepID=UPI001D084761|nr:27 kDa hemolymph glycoprotein-like isoform X1 [Coccinella septempunctata]
MQAKMKFVIILSVFVLSGFAEETKDNFKSEEEDIGFFQALAIQYLRESSFDAQNCSQSSPEKLEEENRKAVECVKNIRYNSTFCDTFTHHFKPCIQGLLDEVKKCADPVGFSFKNTLLDSFIEEAKYICNVDGEHILEIFNPCVLDSVKMSHECRKNITEPIVDRRNPISLCGAFPGMQKCFETQMQKECVNELTKTDLHDLFSVDVKPCNIAMMLYFELSEYLR